MPSLTPSPELLESWRAQHEQAAADFCQLLLNIRGRGAQDFGQGLWGLWQAAEALDGPVREEDLDDVEPSTAALYSGYHLVASVRVVPHAKTRVDAGVGCNVAQRWLLSFEAMARLIREEHTEILAQHSKHGERQAQALCALVVELGGSLNGPALFPLRFHYLPGRPHSPVRITPFGLSADTVEAAPEFDGKPRAWAVLPLVWLPLALYVRSTTHLYEMLERLQLKAVLHRGRGRGSSATNARDGKSEKMNGTDILLGMLDRDERRYSYLVFAITAALQLLHMARRKLGPAFPFSLLASSPPDPARVLTNGYPMRSADSFGDTQAIFRGIWIGKEVDEERARFQYSFQSFSRQIEGVARVLSFYATIAGNPTTKLAEECRHILVLVGRVRWQDPDCLARPVQLVDGPREKDSELEVLFPAYVRYELEEDLEIQSVDFAGPAAEAKLSELRRRWCGFELPPLLLALLRGEPAPEEFHELRLLRPAITVRFIRSVSLPEPLASQFREPERLLYDFAPEDSPKGEFLERPPSEAKGVPKLDGMDGLLRQLAEELTVKE